MAKSKRKRTEYSPKKRAEILAAAKKEGLTALAVQKRFGVKPVTYYSWRRKTGVTRRRGSGISTLGGDALLGRGVRGEVQARIRAVVPALVRSEVSSYLKQALGSNTRRRVRT